MTARAAQFTGGGSTRASLQHPAANEWCSSSGAQPAGRGVQPHPGMTPPARVYGWPVAFGGYVAVVDGARSSA
jgi:hypothetical protein